MTRAERQAARLALGGAALLTEAQAVELVPFSDAKVRAWLRKHELVRDVPGLGRVVHWQRVLDLIDAGEGPAESAPARPAKLPRKNLR